MNERRDDLSTADIAGQPPAGGGAPTPPADDAGRDAGADRDPAYPDAGAAGREDADPDVHRTGGGGGPLDKLRRAFGGDDRGADDRGVDDRGADFGADRGADHDRGADLGADGGAGPVDRAREAFGADDRGADHDRGPDRSPADADDRLLPPPGGAAAPPAPMPIGAATGGPTPHARAPVGSTPAHDAGPPGPGGPGGPAGAPTATGASTTGPLLPSTEGERFRARWTDVQNGFVDSPRQAVEQADRLTAELMQHLAKTFADERSRLEGQWDRGGDVATDDLRTAFQRYRSFFERLLAT